MNKNTKQLIIVGAAFALLIPILYFATNYANQQAFGDTIDFISEVGGVDTVGMTNVEGRWEGLNGPYQELNFNNGKLEVLYKDQERQSYEYDVQLSMMVWEQDDEPTDAFLIYFQGGVLTIVPVEDERQTSSNPNAKKFKFRKVE